MQSPGNRSSVSELCQDVDPKKGSLVMPTGCKSPSEVQLEQCNEAFCTTTQPYNPTDRFPATGHGEKPGNEVLRVPELSEAHLGDSVSYHLHLY